MNKVLGLAAAAIVVIGILVWWFGFRDENGETYVVGRGSIDVTIQTIGRLQSTGATTIRASSPGEVLLIGASAGDTVEEGDIVIQLDPEPFEREIDAARAELDEAEFALQIAQSQADDDPEDEGGAFTVIQAARAVEARTIALSDADAALRDASIQSPRAGIVLEILIRNGDLVNRGQPVARTFSRGDLEVVANVDELDLVNVEPGAAALIRFDAYPSEEVTGSVLETAPQATEQGGATIFATTIALNLPDDLDIRPGMNADVTIVTDDKDDVLLIPQRAIRTVGERTFVDLVVTGESEEREIVVGYRSGADVEVVSGLHEGDVVALP